MESKKQTKEQKKWQKKFPAGKATLSWQLIDYKIWEMQPPECLVNDSSLTEGKQMTDSEIETWFTDSVKALKVLKETEPGIFKRLYKGLISDIKYLISIKRLEAKYLDFVLDKANFEF